MKVPSPHHVEITIWLLVCGGLATTIGLETDWGRQWQYSIEHAEAASVAYSAPAFAEPFKLSPADTLPETSMRPLFVATRRPAPIPPPQEPPKPMMQRNQFVLTGVSIAPGGRYAFLLEKAQSKPRVVALGKEINGLLVSEILADRIVLKQYDDSETLLLVPAKGSPVQQNATDAPRAPGPAGQVRRQPVRSVPDNSLNSPP